MSGFTVYPAIDLKGGQVVRLVKGEMASATVFNPDPADQAARFAALGYRWLHVVDLDGAFEGRAVNAAAVRAILAARGGMNVQLGGGIRALADVARWIEAGIARVILGTAAVRAPNLVREAAAAFPGRIAVGIDARDGKVAVAGWAEATALDAGAFARTVAEAGAAAIIHTDIARDGTGEGLNVAATRAIARGVPVPVIASGGVGSLADVEAARSATPVAGAIVGRALYDGRIDPAVLARL